MKKIMKKKDNVIWGVFPEHSTKEQTEQEWVQQSVGSSKVVSLRHSSHQNQNRDHEAYTYNKKDTWLASTAVACLMLVVGGATMFNIQWDRSRSDGGRKIAQNSLNRERQKDALILESFKTKKRSLSSIQVNSDLLKKEKFRYQVLKSYQISFDLEGFLSEAQLKIDQEPIVIENFSNFIQEHSVVFPEFERLVHAENYLDQEENLHIASYYLEGGDASVLFRTNSEGMLVSLSLERE